MNDIWNMLNNWSQIFGDATINDSVSDIRLIQYTPRCKFLKPRLSKYPWINSLFYSKNEVVLKNAYLSSCKIVNTVDKTSEVIDFNSDKSELN